MSRILPILALLLMSYGCSAYNKALLDSDAEAADSGMSMTDMGNLPVDMGHTEGCAPGKHLCNGACVPASQNIPANGCLFGCGAPCPGAPANARTVCNTQGHCDYACLVGEADQSGVCPAAADAGADDASVDDASVDDAGDVDACVPITDCSFTGFECGTPDNGCGGTVTCPSCTSPQMCMSGVCACGPDSFDLVASNNIADSASAVGTYDDSANTSMTWNLTFANDFDDDYFTAVIVDGFDLGSPKISVTVNGGTATDGYDWYVSADFTCGGSATGNSSSCGSSNSAAMPSAVDVMCSATPDGSGNAVVTIATSCPGESHDNGQLLIHVAPVSMNAGECMAYQLTLYVH